MRTQRFSNIPPLPPRSQELTIGRPDSAVPLNVSWEPDNGVLGSAVYAPGSSATRDTLANRTSGFGDQLSMFQLPQELLDDWPWPFDPMQFEGLLPLGCE